MRKQKFAAQKAVEQVCSAQPTSPLSRVRSSRTLLFAQCQPEACSCCDGVEEAQSPTTVCSRNDSKAPLALRNSMTQPGVQEHYTRSSVGVQPRGCLAPKTPRPSTPRVPTAPRLVRGVSAHQHLQPCRRVNRGRRRAPRPLRGRRRRRRHRVTAKRTRRACARQASAAREHGATVLRTRGRKATNARG